MMTIPNIIDPSVPIGKDDSENVEVREVRRAGGSGFRDPVSYRYHGDALTASIWTAPARASGNGFYYLMGDIARLHSAVISYAT